MEKKKPKKDPFFGLKYIGFSWSNLGLGEVEMNEFLDHCKFLLCVKTHRLMKDPIWDSYTKEELLAEFFAHKFHSSPEAVKEFELYLANEGGEILDFDTWADLQIKKDEAEKQEKIKRMDDSVHFSPGDVLEE